MVKAKAKKEPREYTVVDVFSNNMGSVMTLSDALEEIQDGITMGDYTIDNVKLVKLTPVAIKFTPASLKLA